MVVGVAQARPKSVPREYVEVPGGWNPDVWIFLGALAIFTSSHCGYWLWGWWHWACFWLNVLAIHMAGTVIHDACHRAAHRNHAINTILGHGSALMIGFVFPVFTRVHLQHHAHVNDPKNDPDHFVSTGGPLLLIPPRFFYHEIFFFQRRLWKNYELLEWFVSRAIFGSIVYASFAYGFFPYLVNYWFSPALIVGWALGLFFDYLPHRPFHERNRWRNARVYPSKLLNLAIFGQNYHLVHHLWPSIPWYKYQPAYWATKPLLDAKGSPQSSGLLESPRDFWGFVYDIFIGIRWHRKPSSLKKEVLQASTMQQQES